jgi:hypothetical protein
MNPVGKKSGKKAKTVMRGVYYVTTTISTAISKDKRRPLGSQRNALAANQLQFRMFIPANKSLGGVRNRVDEKIG